MPYILTITKLVEQNDSGIIAGDSRPTPSSNPEDPPVATNYLLSSYQGIYFSVNLEYKVQEVTIDQEGAVTVLGDIPILKKNGVSQIFLTAPDEIQGLATSILENDVLKLTGPAYGMFQDEYFTFLLRDRTKKRLNLLEASSLKDFRAVIEWTMPSTTEKLVNYQLKAYIENQEDPITTTYNQYFYWNLNSSIDFFRSIIAKGTRK